MQRFFCYFILIIVIFTGLSCKPRYPNKIIQPTEFKVKNPLIINRGEIGTYGESLKIGTTYNPKTFNPILANEAPSNDILDLLFRGLVRTNYINFQVEPCLAESWSSSVDGKEWVFVLREGLAWSDGVPITSDDVIFTFQAIFNKEIPNAKRDILMPGNREIEVEKIDEQRVKFILKEPYAPFLRLMDTCIVPAHKLKKFYDEGIFKEAWNINTPPEEIVGNGPYILKEYAENIRIVLDRNPYYFAVDKMGKQLPYLDRIIFNYYKEKNETIKAFQNKEIDVLRDIPPKFFKELKKSSQKEKFALMELGPSNETIFLSFNENQLKQDPIKLGWFTNKSFRQAVALTIDKEAIIKSIYEGLAYPINSPYNPKSPFFNDKIQPIKYDITLAEETLKKAGFFKEYGQLYDEKGYPVQFTIIVTEGNNERVLIANIIKDSLQRLGMSVAIQPVNFNKLVSKLFETYDWDAVVVSFVGKSSIEPAWGKNVWISSGVTHIWYPNQTKPATLWEAEIDRLFEDADREIDPEKRKSYYMKFQEILNEQLPLIYIIAPGQNYAFMGNLGNCEPTPFGGFLTDIDLLSVIFFKKNN